MGGEGASSSNEVEGPDDALDASEGEIEGDAEPNESAPQPDEGSPDVRTSRPEPFEHTFGATAHPAEPAAADPTLQSDATPGNARSTSDSSEPVPNDRPPSASES